MLMGQMSAGGITSFWGESWLYFSVIIPFAITFGVLGGYFRNKDNLSNKRLWLISLISAFFITLFSGTIGAIFGETIVRGGMEYAFVLLPITIPFARLIIGVFYKLIKMLPSK